MKRRERIQAVTVCYNYSSYLKYCINNRELLDRWVVVTTESDVETIELCKRYSIECHFTRRIHDNGARFAKGKAINDGFALLEKSGWFLMLDCDIVLPGNFRELVAKIPNTEEARRSLYSTRGRRGVGVPEDYVATRIYKNHERLHDIYLEKYRSLNWRERKMPAKHQQIRRLISKQGLWETQGGPMKEQWSNFVKGKWDKLPYIFEGYEAKHIGYLQLFHAHHFDKYPEVSDNQNFDDTNFRDEYPPERRITLDVDCVHIGLPATGKDYISYLDSVAFSKKNKGEMSYLNDIYEARRAQSSNLTSVPGTKRKKATAGTRFVLIEETKAKSVPHFQNVWNIWEDTIVKVDKRVDKVAGVPFPCLHLIPNKKKIWFALSIEGTPAISRGTFENIFFDLKVSDLNCDLEVGFGDATRVEWLPIKVDKLKNNEWYQFRIEFSKTRPFEHIRTLFAIRSLGHYSKGTISLSEIYYR